MDFSNLLKQTKDVDIHGIKVTIKKYSLGFSEWLSLKTFEGREVKPLGNDKVQIKAGEKALALVSPVERLVEGVVVWDLKDDKGEVVKPTHAVVTELVKEYPEFAGTILEEIEEFNRVTDDKKKSSETS